MYLPLSCDSPSDNLSLPTLVSTVLACSILATICALLYTMYVGEDSCLDFGETSTWTGKAIGDVMFFGLVMSKKRLGSYLWALYISHYACATADTWASEVGVLAMENPTLLTSLLFLSLIHI